VQKVDGFNRPAQKLYLELAHPSFSAESSSPEMNVGRAEAPFGI
jgi:hypothetical protein